MAGKQGFAVVDHRGRVIAFVRTQAEARQVLDEWASRPSVATRPDVASLVDWVATHPDVRVGQAPEGLGDQGAPLVAVYDPGDGEAVARCPAPPDLVAWCERHPARVEPLVTFTGTFVMSTTDLEPEFWEPGLFRGWAFRDGAAAHGSYHYPSALDPDARWTLPLAHDGPPRRSTLRAAIKRALRATLEPYSGQGIRDVKITWRGI